MHAAAKAKQRFLQDRSVRAQSEAYEGMPQSAVPGVSMTLSKWVHDPILFFKGHGDSR